MWNESFLQLHQSCVGKYRAGRRDHATFFSPDDLAFLATIGCKPREFFDFIEDFCDEGTPGPSTALLVAAVRRDYFLAVQNGRPDPAVLTPDQLPTFGDQLDGITYLPRILAKARAKLRGTLDPDIMFCCGGDRRFLRQHGNIHPADFLRQVWAAADDDNRIAGYVAACARR